MSLFSGWVSTGFWNKQKLILFKQASGALGTPVLKALVDSGKFNVTVISREESKATFPSSVKVVTADYKSVESLTFALRDQDAVVSTVGTDGLLGQSIFIDAAIAAGVKRFLPSEFGSDLSNPNAAKLPIFGYKVATRNHLEEKIRNGANLSYTYVINSAFLGMSNSAVVYSRFKSILEEKNVLAHLDLP